MVERKKEQITNNISRGLVPLTLHGRKEDQYERRPNMSLGLVKPFSRGIIRPSRPSRLKGEEEMQVNVSEAKTHLPELVNSVATREKKEVIIARRGKPLVKMIPYEEPKKRTIGIANGTINVPETVEEFDKSNDIIAEMFGL